jgi:phenylalanine-4-hydroxylase
MMNNSNIKNHKYISNPVDPQGYVNWSQQENDTWSVLVDRQREIIKGRACQQFLDGIEILDFSNQCIPQIPDINAALANYTGWGIEPVPAIIQPKEFFSLLANKKFPAATFIRTPEEIDYLQEPDIFHEIYGHTPLLTNQNYADFMEKFGTLALAIAPKDRTKLFRLFWFTIEFGLINTQRGLKAYGGGILSSIGETQSCLSDKVETQPFDTLTVLRTPYRIDIMQPMYYVINDFSDLFTILDQDIQSLLEQANTLGDLPAKYQNKSA